MTGKVFRSLMASNTRLIEDISSDIDAAGSLGDREFVRFGISLLTDVMEGSVDLIQRFYKGQERSGSLGAPEEKGRHWQDGSPSEVLENMRVMMTHYTALIRWLAGTAYLMDDEVEERALDRQRIQYLREMAFRAQIGKMVIMQKDPSFWTAAMEIEFKDPLEYRLSY